MIRVAHLILMAHSITQNSCEFLLCRNLPDAICRHPSSSCFFSHLCIVIKKLHTNFSLLTKACRFSIVQSTTAGTTTCALYHCLLAVTYSLAVVPKRKLLQYSHCQGYGVKYHHLVGICPQHHMYCIICYNCMHIMHDSSLAGMSSQSCSTVLYHVYFSQCTTIQYTSLSYFEVKLS